MTKPQVLIHHCAEYDSKQVAGFVRDALKRFGLVPRGRTLVKPNLVTSGEMFPHAYTRPEFTEGVLRALRDHDTGEISELAVGERSAITVPTRFNFEQAGYDEMLERVGDVKRYCFEDEVQVEVPLTHPERLRDYVYTPEPIAKADFFVNCPKFKAHPWTTVTFSTKAYIGIQDDRHRLIDHDHRLGHKIADLQYILQPQLICIDAITAGEGRMLTPLPYPLKLVILGNNSVATDAVCCQILGLDPHDIEHIRLASERGFGPIDLDSIEIGGGVSLEQARERAKDFRVGLVRVEKYFEGTKISAYAGPPPEEEYTDYCWGGCPGALEEAIEVLRLYDQQCDEKLPRLHVVFGAYQGPIDAAPGERVLFIGDCARYDGRVGDQLVQIKSTYEPRSTKDPRHASEEDIIDKSLKVARELLGSKGQTVYRFHGCPVSVAEQILLLAEVGGVNNPYLSKGTALPFARHFLANKAGSLGRRWTGRPYQTSQPPERGRAAPQLSSQNRTRPSETE